MKDYFVITDNGDKELFLSTFIEQKTLFTGTDFI